MSELKKSKWPLWFTGVLLALPVCYLLSVGQFLWLATHDMLPAGLEEVPIYAPLQSLEDSWPPFRSVVRQYLRIWGIDVP
jgi:hypothetical protein